MRNKSEVIRDEVLDKLLNLIENKNLSWEKGWFTSKLTAARNVVSQDKYNGFNQLLLTMTSLEKNYPDNRWLTFNQASEMGARIKKGEKATPIFKYRLYDKKMKRDYYKEDFKHLSEDELEAYENENVVKVLKHHYVFNVSQCENIAINAPQETMSEEEKHKQNQLIEKIIANSEAKISHDGNGQAFYRPSTDSIHLPKVEEFKSMQEYYATALHEIAHSTGHQSRLNRDMGDGFGTPTYAREELVAELASVFMQLDYGIKVEGNHIENHAAYLQSWLKSVKENKKVFYDAVKAAEAVSDYVKTNYIDKSKQAITDEVQEQIRAYAKSIKLNSEEALKEAEKLVEKTNQSHVLIYWSESPYEKLSGENIIMTFDEADKLLSELNDNFNGIGYDKTKLVILTPFQSKVVKYDKRYDIGNEPKGGLIGSIKSFVEFSLGREDLWGISQETANDIYEFIKSVENHRYSIVKTSEETRTQENEEIIFNKSVSFATQVDAVLNGIDTTSTHIHVMDTPFLLRQVGAKKLPMLITAKHIKSIILASGPESMNYHDVDKDIVKRLPELLSDPVMIMDSFSANNAVVVVTSEVDKDNNPIVAAVKMDGKGNINNIEIDANILASAYGKDNFSNFIDKNVQAGNILYWNSEKADELFNDYQITFPQNLYQIVADTIIKKFKGYVPTVKSPAPQNSNAGQIKKESGNETPGIQFPDNNVPNSTDILSNKSEVVNSDTIINLELDYGNEALLGNELEKMGFKFDGSNYEKNEEANRVGLSKNLPYWNNITKYKTSDGKEILGNSIVENKVVYFTHTIFDSFQLKGFSESEINEFTKIVESLGGKVKSIKHLNENNTTNLNTQNNAIEKENTKDDVSVKTEEKEPTVAKNKEFDVVIKLSSVVKQDNVYKIKINKGQFKGYSMSIPEERISLDENTKEYILKANENRGYFLMKDNLALYLNGNQIADLFNGNKLNMSKADFAKSIKRLNNFMDLDKNIPSDMKKLKNWAVFKTYYDEEKGKYQKIILDPNNGHRAKSNDETTWTSYEKAFVYALEHNCAGLSFALDGKCGISCIDLDKCIDENGNFNDTSKFLTTELKNTYIEKSVSGKGVHLFMKDSILDNKFKNRALVDDGEIEVYEDGRFMSMTGNMISKTNELGRVPTSTKLWLRERLGEKIALNTNQEPSRFNQTDEEVINRIKRSKRAQDFETLYNGGSIIGDKSRDDMMFLNILAFFTDCNKDQIERIFLASARDIKRSEAGQRKSSDYLKRSIEKAVASLQTRIGTKNQSNNQNTK